MNLQPDILSPLSTGKQPLSALPKSWLSRRGMEKWIDYMTGPETPQGSLTLLTSWLSPPSLWGTFSCVLQTFLISQTLALALHPGFSLKLLESNFLQEGSGTRSSWPSPFIWVLHNSSCSSPSPGVLQRSQGIALGWSPCYLERPLQATIRSQWQYQLI